MYIVDIDVLTELIYASGDAFSFTKLITISGLIEIWMKQLLDAAHNAMSDQIQTYINKSASVLITNWFFGVPSYITFTMISIKFSREVDECFNAYESNIRSFTAYEGRLRSRYNDLISLIDSPISSKEYIKMETALSLIMNHIDIIRLFTEVLQSNWIL